MNRRALIATLVILVLAVASTWFSRETRRVAPPPRSETPDYFVEGLTAIELGEDGRPVQRLDAVRLTHFPTREALVLQPRVTVFTPGGSPWKLRATQGQVSGDGAQLNLTGGVHIVRQGPGASEIVTESLQVDPEREYVQTDDPVTVTTAQGRLQAVGMEAFLGEERIILRSQVRGTYGP